MCISAKNKRNSLSVSASAPFLGGCIVGPDFQAPAPPTVSHYTMNAQSSETSSARGVVQSFEISQALPADWWSLFASPALDQAVKDALQKNPTIAPAEATLKEAQDQLKAGQGIFYPQVNAGFSAAQEHPATDASPLHFQEGTFNLFTLSADISYTLDIFGGERRQIEGLGAEVDFQKNSARIANTFIALAAYDAKIDLTNEIIALEKEQVALARGQAQAGTAAYAAQLSLESQLQATEVTLPDLLAMLEGKLPAEGQLIQIKFDDISLPQKLPVSLPSSLVKERPDILEAEVDLHLASAQIGVATAAMLPNVTLSAGVGSSDISTTSLFGSASDLWSLGTGITQPIFDGGTLRYRRQAALDAYDAAAADYRQTVLSAFQQVADTLRALEHDAEALSTDDQAVATARRALALVQANYASGIATYSEVLIADGQYSQARISDIQANTVRYQDTVTLFAALGGGWWNQPEDIAMQK